MTARPLILLLSLAANVALAALVYSRHASGQTAKTTETTAVDPGLASPGGSATAPQKPDIPGGDPADAGYVARLRAAGLPADLIRELVFHRVQARYRERRRALLPDATDQYWRWNQPDLRSASPETRAKVRALAKEMEAEIGALLGNGPEALDGYQRRLYDQMSGYLANAKIQQIEAIRKDYEEMASEIRAQGKGLVLKADREQLRLLEVERRRDLEAVLTPEELLEYELRASPTANNVRNRLAYFEPSEDEYRALTKLQLEFDRQYGLNNLSGAEQDRRKAAEKELTARIQTLLTPDRFADYRVTIDGMFWETLAFTGPYNLDVTAAKAIVALKQSTWQRIDELDQAGVTGAQRNAALKALDQEVETQLTAHLGADIAANYKRSGASWMKRLQPAPPQKS